LPAQAFIAEVRSASAEGFFSFDSIADTFTHCFAAPVQDSQGTCVATLCIVAPRDDARVHYQNYRRVLIDSADRLAWRTRN
jgi:DNA-binding IclR family transcriptional regulator